MVTLGEMLFVMSPMIMVFGVLLSADHIVAWWDKKHPPESDQ